MGSAGARGTPASSRASARFRRDTTAVPAWRLSGTKSRIPATTTAVKVTVTARPSSTKVGSAMPWQLGGLDARQPRRGVPTAGSRAPAPIAGRSGLVPGASVRAPSRWSGAAFFVTPVRTASSSYQPRLPCEEELGSEGRARPRNRGGLFDADACLDCHGRSVR